MTLSTRRIIYITFIAAFLIAAPLLILYTSGYRYNPKKQKVQSTGALVLRVKPNDADVLVNGERQKKPALFDTEIRLPDLIPGDYKIEVWEEGYTAWQKTLMVEPNKSTYALTIQLFKKGLVAAILNREEKIYSWPAGQKKLLTFNKKFNLFDISKDNFLENKLLLDSSLTEPEIIWSAAQEKIIFKDKIKIILWETLTQNEKDLTPTLNKFKGLEQLQWPEHNTDNLYFIYRNSLWQMSAFTLEPKLVLADFASENYLADERFIYSVENKNNKETTVKIYPLGELEKPTILTLPKVPSGVEGQEYKLYSHENNLLPILDQKNEVLHLYDLDNPKHAQTIIPGVKNFIFSENKDKILYYNDFEIWNLDLKKDKKNLLTRISQEIQEVEWYNQENYVIYALENAIYILEIDDRDKRNLVEIVSSIKDIQKFEIIDDKLYFQGQLGGNLNLFELDLE